MHGNAWSPHGEPSHQWGLEVTQMRGDVRSYQGTSEVQGEAGHTMWQRETPMCLTGMHGDMGRVHHHGKTWMFGVTKLKNMPACMDINQ